MSLGGALMKMTAALLRGLIGLSLVTGLAACLSTGEQSVTRRSNVLDQAALAGGEVIVAAPQGYCIQKDSLKPRSSGGFALVASCEQLTGFVSGYQVEPVVMTVSAVPRASEAPEPDAAEIASALGDRKVLRRLHGDGLTVVQVQSVEALSAEADPTHWRGMMVINGYMVGLALYGPRDSAASREKGLTQMMWLAERIREESPQRLGELPSLFSDGSAPAFTDATALSGASGSQTYLRPVLRPVARPGTPVAMEEVTTAPEAAEKTGKPILGTLFGRIFG